MTPASRADMLSGVCVHVCCVAQAMLDACENGDSKFVRDNLPRLKDAKDGSGMSPPPP